MGSREGESVEQQCMSISDLCNFLREANGGVARLLDIVMMHLCCGQRTVIVIVNHLVSENVI